MQRALHDIELSSFWNGGVRVTQWCTWYKVKVPNCPDQRLFDIFLSTKDTIMIGRCSERTHILWRESTQNKISLQKTKPASEFPIHMWEPVIMSWNTGDWGWNWFRHRIYPFPTHHIHYHRFVLWKSLETQEHRSTQRSVTTCGNKSNECKYVGNK